MAQTGSRPRIRERLAGHRVLVTGSTGFLAKAFVEKLLRAADTIDGLYLLVRTRPDGVGGATVSKGSSPVAGV